jgi:hypothetical protein
MLKIFVVLKFKFYWVPHLFVAKSAVSNSKEWLHNTHINLFLSRLNSLLWHLMGFQNPSPVCHPLQQWTAASDISGWLVPLFWPTMLSFCILSLVWTWTFLLNILLCPCLLWFLVLLFLAHCGRVMGRMGNDRCEWFPTIVFTWSIPGNTF